MGCCGEDKTPGEARKDIAKAHVRHAFAKITNARPPEHYTPRYEKCRVCPHRTWLSRKEQVLWVWDNKGVIAKHTNEIAERTTELPVHLEQFKGASLCCRSCRCPCAAKARDADADCCEGLWADVDNNIND